MADTKKYILEEPGYEKLAWMLSEAYDQSAFGKGKERHANGQPFERQPIVTETLALGPGFAIGQARKKLLESKGMVDRGEIERALEEAKGAIIYTAAYMLWLQNELGGFLE